MNDTEQKPLTKHIQTAVNAIEKQIDKYAKARTKLLQKAQSSEDEANELAKGIEGLREQISKLKGE